MTTSVFVISDIDGTLVPHPYTSGLSPAQRSQAVARVGTLTQNPRFSLVTGREWNGYGRLFAECQLPLQVPQALGVDFGAQIYHNGRKYNETTPSVTLGELIQELVDQVKEFGPELPITGPGSASSQGKFKGYVFEKKEAVLQIEWDFEDHAKDTLFCNKVTKIVNSFLLPGRGLYAQIFANRIDVMPHHVIPKSTFWPYFQEILKYSQAQWAETHLYLFGDELYDAYMFRTFLTTYRPLFKEVTAVSVGSLLPHATQTCASPAEALAQVEQLLLG